MGTIQIYYLARFVSIIFLSSSITRFRTVLVSCSLHQYIPVRPCSLLQLSYFGIDQLHMVILYELLSLIFELLLIFGQIAEHGWLRLFKSGLAMRFVAQELFQNANYSHS